MFINFRRIVSFVSLTAFLCVGATNSFAHTGSGGNCASCHSPDSNRMNISGNTGTMSVNPRLDLGSTADLPYFQVTAGQSIPLTINVTNGGAVNDMYAPALTGTVKSGVLESLATTIKGVQSSTNDLLAITPDATWTKKTPSSGTYFTTSALSWTCAPLSKTYNLSVAADTTPDVYSMTFRASGVDAGGEWTQSQEFLVKVVAAVPEPSIIFMLLSGLGVACIAWRRAVKLLPINQ